MVLIVIDLVQDYFNPALWPNSRLPESRQRLVTATNELAALFRAKNFPIIWFRQEFAPDLSDAFLHMKQSGKLYAIRGKAGCQLLPELQVAPEDRILVKKRYSAFFQTELDAVLSHLQPHTLVLAGITTAWCVRSTAVDAYQRDYRVLLAQDAMAGFIERDHLESLNAMNELVGTALSNAEIARVIVNSEAHTGSY
ncbi:MAG: cysteine hydrolase family protein [bacterium]